MGIIDDIIEQMRGKTTEELTSIWTKNDRSAWSDSAFEAIKQVLTEREVLLPQQDSDLPPASVVSVSGEKKADNQQETSFGSKSAMRLVGSSYPWWGFILIQAGILLLPQEGNFMHTVSMVLAAISVLLMYNFGPLLSLRQKEVPSAYRYLSNQFLAMAVGGILIFALACAIGSSKLMQHPNIFRNLIIVTGSVKGMWILWLSTCAAIAIMGVILRRQVQKTTDD